MSLAYEPSSEPIHISGVRVQEGVEEDRTLTALEEEVRFRPPIRPGGNPGAKR